MEAAPKGRETKQISKKKKRRKGEGKEGRRKEGKNERRRQGEGREKGRRKKSETYLENTEMEAAPEEEETTD